MNNPLNRRDFLKLSSLAFSSLLLGAPTSRTTDRLRLIQKYGVATRIPAFEFHGDNYFMYDGAYCMNPDTFRVIMNWLQENEVWAATAQEVEGYLSGEISLPARSVILTTDSGSVSKTSLARMIPVLQETGMHFISFLWTRYMRADESITCQEDACWTAFRDALDSGTFSMGTHTETHRDFALLSEADGINDLLESKKEIEDTLGVSPTLISWPFESVPNWADELRNYGFVGAFAGGGSRKTMKENVILPSEPSPWDLPRILPPNIGTLTSGRPAGMTLPEIMDMFTNGFGDNFNNHKIQVERERLEEETYFRKLRPPR